MALIQLLDGRQVDSANVFFDDSNYSFKLGGTGEDITTKIRNVDKRTFPGFDNEKYNEILYVQNYRRTHNGQSPPDVGSTSTWDNFVSQIATDPLAAPLDALNSGVSQIFNSPGIKTVIIAGVVLVAAVLLLQHSGE